MIFQRIAFALVLLPMAAVVSAQDKSLIGHWTFDETEGQIARDSSGNGRDGKVHGATWTKGVTGGALRFDGKDDYVALGDLGDHAAVTIAFWMNSANLATNAWQGLVSSDAWEKGVFHAPSQIGCVDVYLHLGGRERARLMSSPLNSNAWHHVALTADTKTHAAILYINGVEESVTSISKLDTPIRLLKQVVGREDKQRYFRGMMDDVRIYSRALGAGEVLALCPNASPAPRDWRNIRFGLSIPDENYCDQPYVVVTKDGGWLCTLTTGRGQEGQKGQHIVSTTSYDKGRTWSSLVDIEPADGPEASWVVPLVTPGGRVYAFYTYNGDNIRTLNGKAIRADTIGWYAYKFSDDGGASWSKERYRLPMRVTANDRKNDFNGAVQLFWGIDKPNIFDGVTMFAFTKLRKYMLSGGEGWVYRSDNILTEREVAKLRWELLPDRDASIRGPEFGSTQEEHNMVFLTGKTLFCVYRTTLGYPCQSYSEDGGHTWSKPEFMTYTPGGRKVKTPRACPQTWRTHDGRFLFWFHNHSGTGFTSRNPVWILGGVAKGGRIHWSQPEILLYDPSPQSKMSYPDLVEQDGRYWFTETQKTVARVHEADKTLLEGLWSQGKVKTVTRDGLIFESKGGKLPNELDLAKTHGLTLDCWLKLDNLAADQVLVDSRDKSGKGIVLTTTAAGTVRIELNDGTSKAAWDCDPGVLQAGKLHHVVAIVDCGPRIISFVVDGIFCDGGEARKQGWERYPTGLGDVRGSGTLRLAPSLKSVRLYGRYLRTSEAIANFNAGP